MRMLELGELSAVVTGGSDGRGGGDGPAVVLLHGFGAPGTDLVPLAGELALPPAVRFVFPMAPGVLERGPAELVARAWWMIDILALQSAVAKSDLETIVKYAPAGLPEARKAFESLLDALEQELGVDPARLVIGGFSQGAMLSSATFFESDRRFAGLVILSGMLIHEPLWSERAPERRGLPVFQSHGSEDPILPFAVAKLLAERLRKAGVDLDWNEFEGGHGIPARVLERLGVFLRRTLGVEA